MVLILNENEQLRSVGKMRYVPGVDPEDEESEVSSPRVAITQTVSIVDTKYNSRAKLEPLLNT